MVQSLNLSKRTLLGVGLVLTLGALSVANWGDRGRFGVPEDGVMWIDSEAGVLASRVETKSPAALVGVRPGDILLSIGGRPVDEALDATRILAEFGAWTRAEYVIERDGLSEASLHCRWRKRQPGCLGRVSACARLELRVAGIACLAARRTERRRASILCVLARVARCLLAQRDRPTGRAG